MVEPFDFANRALVVSNTSSGTNLKRGVDAVQRIADDAGLKHCCVADMDELEEVLEASAARDDRLVIVNAGDGTVCRVLQFMREGGKFSAEPVLALLRGGTTNMIHNDVGIPGKPETALRNLLRSLSRGAYGHVERHALRVTGPAGSAPSRYGFFFATHAATKAILETRKRFHQRGSTGRLSEALSMGMMAWRLIRRRVETDPLLAPVSLAVSRDGEPWREESHILLLAMTVRNAILGVRPLRHGQRAGLAELSWPDYRALPWLWHVIRGNLTEFAALALRGRFSWILDGEVYAHDGGELHINVDGPVRFLVREGS